VRLNPCTLLWRFHILGEKVNDVRVKYVPGGYGYRGHVDALASEQAPR